MSFSFPDSTPHGPSATSSPSWCQWGDPWWFRLGLDHLVHHRVWLSAQGWAVKSSDGERAAPAHPSPTRLYIDKHPLSFLLCQRSRCKMLPKITPFPASFFLFLLFPHFFYYYSYYIIIIIIIILLGICCPQSPIPTPWTVSTPWLI